MPLPGEIWLAEIPFTSGTASKLRPVVVLWTDAADVVDRRSLQPHRDPQLMWPCKTGREPVCGWPPR